MRIRNIEDFTNLVMSEFEDMTLDGGVSLEGAELIDLYSLDYEIREANVKQYGVSWKKVKRDYVRRHADCSLGYLDSIGFRYYLPLFLLYSFKGSLSIFDEDVLEPMLLYWIVAAENGMNPGPKMAFDGLTYSQKSLIACYFKVVEEKYRRGGLIGNVEDIPAIRSAFFADF